MMIEVTAQAPAEVTVIALNPVVVREPSPDWLLITGFWDDGGVWDDVSEWEDAA